ncbi:MAG TPA: phytanoyl-CoA dioxygenase family protein [Acidimicrobiales bacterium]|nr:phytanoyl-CoA dioxygenase family protein [Acidimicrobiales bacterium]
MPADVDVDHFATHGWVLTRSHDRVGDVRAWVDEVAAWPDDDGPWLHHRELTDHGPKLCRSENFVPFHPGLRGLLTTGPMLDAASALLGEPAVLYKEKINYKLPGGAGYAPHQDAPAYRFVERHVSCMVAVDDALVGNGCLEVVSGMHHEVLPTDDAGCIRADVVATLAWAPVEVQAGETLWFHSRTPHRSGPNPGPLPRRALYPTYNALAEGDLRAAYYEQKAAELAAASPDDRVPVSLIGDFQGRPVT